MNCEPDEAELFSSGEDKAELLLFSDCISLKWLSVKRDVRNSTLYLIYQIPLRRGRNRRGRLILWHSEYYVIRKLLREYPNLEFEASCLPPKTPAEIHCQILGCRVTLQEIIDHPAEFVHDLDSPAIPTSRPRQKQLSFIL